MKKLLLFIILTSSAVFAFAQSEYQGKPLTYSEVIQIDNISKDALYDRAKAFFISVYSDASEVIQLDDKEKGIISARGTESYNDGSMYKYAISYTITIMVKDGRYKYEVKDVTLKGLRWSDFYLKWMDTYNDLVTDADLSESFYNEQKKKGRRKIKPDPSYMQYRDETKKFISSLIIAMKDKMNEQSTMLEDDW